MQTLLSPEGCPWDREQTLESLRQYVIEEAHAGRDNLGEALPVNARGLAVLHEAAEVERAEVAGLVG